MLPQVYFLMVAAGLFCIGLIGALTRKNTLLVLMSVDLMLNAVILNFAAFSTTFKMADAALRGQIFAVFVMVIAAAEVGVGLAIILLLFSKKQTIEIGKFSSLKG